MPIAELKPLAGLKLVPGMPAEVYNRAMELTAPSYLLKRLCDQMSKAFMNAEEVQSNVCLLTSQAANCCNCSRQKLALSVNRSATPRQVRSWRRSGRKVVVLSRPADR